MDDNDLIAVWRDYAEWLAVRALRDRQYCQVCDGFGDHGIEEESNCRYICYACGGTGFEVVDLAQ